MAALGTKNIKKPRYECVGALIQGYIFNVH